MAKRGKELKTECLRGHAMTPENTYLFTSKTTGKHIRKCRECHRLQQRDVRFAKTGKPQAVFEDGRMVLCHRGHKMEGENIRLFTRSDGSVIRRCQACCDIDAQQRRAKTKRPRPVTHCVNGHEYTEENTYWHTSGDGYRRRMCRICMGKRSREQYERNRGKS